MNKRLSAKVGINILICQTGDFEYLSKMNSTSNKEHKFQERKLIHVVAKAKSLNSNCVAENNNKRKRDEFKFGNYRNYYTKRLGVGEQQTDFRLELLRAHPEYFRSKKVLDIGCNSGFVTVNFAKLMLPASVLGVDIDGDLIDKARRELEKEKTDVDLTDGEKEALNHVIYRKVCESQHCEMNFN